jgi:hypothetical protein
MTKKQIPKRNEQRIVQKDKENIPSRENIVYGRAESQKMISIVQMEKGFSADSIEEITVVTRLESEE